MVEVRDGVGGPWRAKVAGAVGSSTVVVANVFREYDPQVPLTEDQHVVGDFGLEGADEPFSETARPRTPRWNPDHVDAHIGKDGVEGGCELASTSAWRISCRYASR
jgi:hypothetical protein